MVIFLSVLPDYLPGVGFLRYIAFRTSAALITSALLVFLVSPVLIGRLKFWQGEGQPIRADGPRTHFKKAGTPTMGGLIMLFGILISTVLWCDWSNVYIRIVIGIMTAFACIGFYDDYLKVIRKDHHGISGKLRLSIEFSIAIPAAYLLMQAGSSEIAFPFIYDIGLFFIPFAAFIIVGSSNAVNLTDGLDGLAIVPVMVASLSFALISYFSGNIFFSGYFQIHFIPGTGELTVFLGSIIGAGLGFLWFNISPAAIFMGDTGSLALGSILGSVSVVTKHEVFLILTGAVFVLEAFSVIIQVICFKLTGRRVFFMAPIHHHFEKKGWTESQVVIRFWIISILCAFIGLYTLKLR